jgi:hypothetical protein
MRLSRPKRCFMRCPFLLYSHRPIRWRLLILFPNRCESLKVWRKYACTECNQNASKIVWEKLRDPGKSILVLVVHLFDYRRNDRSKRGNSSSKPTFHYNLVDVQRTTVAGQDKFAPGKHIIVVDFKYDGPGVGP